MAVLRRSCQQDSLDHGAEILLATLGPRPSTGTKADKLSACRESLSPKAITRLEWMPNPGRDVDASGKWLLALAIAISEPMSFI